MLGEEVPGHRQEQIMRTLIVYILEAHLFSLFQMFVIVPILRGRALLCHALILAGQHIAEVKSNGVY